MALTAIAPSTKARVNAIAVDSHVRQVWILKTSLIRNMSVILAEIRTMKPQKTRR